jgi:hypothetical protein|tara:strand:- start:187 stop:342 length:156 start_codon:yes stop_codon:yes gene_type:complete
LHGKEERGRLLRLSEDRRRGTPLDEKEKAEKQTETRAEIKIIEFEESEEDE